MTDIEDLRKKMDGNRILFLDMDVETFSQSGAELLCGMASGEERVIYVSISRPVMTCKQTLEKEEIGDDNVFFIDGSNADEDAVRDENVVFINPSNLTELSISLTQAVEKLKDDGPMVVVIDAITSLNVYHDENTMRRFILMVANKMREQGVPVLMLGGTESVSSGLRSSIQQFVDETVEWKPS